MIQGTKAANELKGRIQALLDKTSEEIRQSGIVKEILDNDKDIEAAKGLGSAGIPYILGLSMLVRDYRQEFGNNKEFRDVMLGAIDANYLWQRLKPLVPDFKEIEDTVGVVLADSFLNVLKNWVLQTWDSEVPNEVSMGKDKKEAYPYSSAIAKKTKEFIAEVTKIGGIIFNQNNASDVFSEDGISVETGTIGKKRKKSIRTFVTMSYDELRGEGVNIPSWDKLTPYDREILSIVSSLYDAGNEYQSMDLIGRALAGNRINEASLTPTQRENIINALRKLRSAQITIDSSQEYEAHYNLRGHYEGALLPSEHIEIMELNGQKVRDCIHIFRTSPLYEYAKSKNQLARVDDIKLLDVPLHLTSEYIVLRGYLIRQITSMKSDKSNIRPVILFDTIYKHLEIGTKGYSEQDLRKIKKRIRDATKKILEYWKEQGFIKGFEEVSEGRKITKVKITI